MEIRKNIPKFILATSLTIALILWPITLLSLNPYSWFLIQKKYDIKLSEEEIKMYNHQIASFFKEKDENLYFITQAEALHMQNVKDLITKSNLLFLASITLFFPTLFYLGKTKSVKTILKKDSFFVLLFVILLLGFSFFEFEKFFLGFHKIFFVDNYFFPPTSMLKTLYPDAFFKDIFALYLLLTSFGCLITLLISYKIKV